MQASCIAIGVAASKMKRMFIVFLSAALLLTSEAAVQRPAPDCIAPGAVLQSSYQYYTSDFQIRSSFNPTQTFNTFYTKVRPDVG